MEKVKMAKVHASVFAFRYGSSDKYWVIFSSKDTPWWATYYGRSGRKGKTTVYHSTTQSETNSDVYVAELSKTKKGYDFVTSFSFDVPLALLGRTTSTSTRTGFGGLTVTATEVLLELYYDAYKKETSSLPPCRSAVRQLFQKSDALESAEYIEILGFNPFDESLYSGDKTSTYWKIWLALAEK